MTDSTAKSRPPVPPGLDAVLNARRFKPHVRPPPLRPVYTLIGRTVSTPANLTAISSAIKTGKSAVIGAMCAAAMAQDKSAVDLLGFDSDNPDGLPLFWFDSEQSPDDFWHGVNRAVQRAGLTTLPAWLHAFCLTGFRSITVQVPVSTQLLMQTGGVAMELIKAAVRQEIGVKLDSLRALWAGRGQRATRLAQHPRRRRVDARRCDDLGECHTGGGNHFAAQRPGG